MALIGDVHKANPILENLKFVEEAIQALEGGIRTKFDFDHETGAMVPMTEAKVLSGFVEQLLKYLQIY